MSVEMFAGFVSPTKNFFHLPNNWTDITAEIDNLAELKIVTYVARHTWGYQEYGISKRISTDEFMEGRKRHDGSRIDRGTGLSKQSVIDGISRAMLHGYLDCERDDSDKARIKKFYKLRMSSSPNNDLDPRCLESRHLGSRSLTPDVNDLDSDGCQESRQPMSSSLTSAVKNLDSRGVDSRHRSEKETLERNQRKTLKKEREIPDASVSPKPASLSLSSQKTFDQEKPAHVVHPVHQFLLLDDAIDPSTLTILLTSKEFESEMEDKRRGFLAQEVKYDLEQRGHHLEYRWEREQERKVIEVEAVEAPQKTSLLESLTDEQIDFWRRWCALSKCGDASLTSKIMPDIAWLAQRITTTMDLESLYQSTCAMLLEYSKAQGKPFTPPHVKNLVKHHPTWQAAQEVKRKQSEQASQKAPSGTGVVRNWTMERLSGKLEAPPIVYEPLRPAQAKKTSDEMSIKGAIGTLRERYRQQSAH